MTSHSITLSRRVSAPPERVWRVLTRIRGAAEVSRISFGGTVALAAETGAEPTGFIR